MAEKLTREQRKAARQIGRAEALGSILSGLGLGTQALVPIVAAVPALGTALATAVVPPALATAFSGPAVATTAIPGTAVVPVAGIVFSVLAGIEQARTAKLELHPAKVKSFLTGKERTELRQSGNPAATLIQIIQRLRPVPGFPELSSSLADSLLVGALASGRIRKNPIGGIPGKVRRAFRSAGFRTLDVVKEAVRTANISPQVVADLERLAGTPAEVAQAAIEKAQAGQRQAETRAIAREIGGTTLFVSSEGASHGEFLPVDRGRGLVPAPFNLQPAGRTAIFSEQGRGLPRGLDICDRRFLLDPRHSAHCSTRTPLWFVQAGL